MKVTDPFTRTPGVAGKALMSNPSAYPVYRDRLINKHLVDGNTRGYLRINLPRFEKYIEIWGSD